MQDVNMSKFHVIFSQKCFLNKFIVWKEIILNQHTVSYTKHVHGHDYKTSFTPCEYEIWSLHFTNIMY